METLKTIIDGLSKALWDFPEAFPIMVFLLASTGLYLTWKMRFVQFRHLGHSFKIILGIYDDPNEAGDVSHFQALSAALSATIGIGNIAGVATAIHYGGPGAVFWLWVTGFLGMATKFVECSLGHKHRVIHKDGSASGGPMYYMKNALGGKWTWVAVLFAVCTFVSSFGSGNAVQAFTMADSFRADFGIPPWITGMISATLVGLVIIGGIKRIGRVASKLVPFMGVLYVLAALAVLLLNYEALPGAISLIVRSAFTPQGEIGGFAGSTFIFTLTWGVKRGLFSNEAGQGSAPIAHAAAKTTESVREGAVAQLGPLIDTVVICALTGLVVVSTGTWNDKVEESLHINPSAALTVMVPGGKVQPMGGIEEEDVKTGEVAVVNGEIQDGLLVRNHCVMEDVSITLDDKPFNGSFVLKDGGIDEVRTGDGAEIQPGDVAVTGMALLNGSPLTAESYRRGLLPIFPSGNLFITFAVFLFALSTAISWSYYGDRAILFVFGQKAVWIYRVAFVAVHFLGAIFSLELVWGFADVALAIMAIPNLLAIILLSGVVKKDADDYYKRMGYKGL